MEVKELSALICKYQVLSPVEFHDYNGFHYIFSCSAGKFSIPTLCNNLFGNPPHKRDWKKVGLQLEILLNNKGILFIYEKV